MLGLTLAVGLAFIVGWTAGEWAASSREERRLSRDWVNAARRRQWERHNLR